MIPAELNRDQAYSPRTWYSISVEQLSLDFSRISLCLNQSISTSNLSEIEKEEHKKKITMINLQEALPTCSNEEGCERFIEVADRLTDKFISAYYSL
jgi:hypothetical protein